MNVRSQPIHSALPLAQRRQVDDACCRFERYWRDADSPERRPRIEAYLELVAEPARAHLISELVALEIDLRRLDGLAVEPNDYHARFPSLTLSCSEGDSVPGPPDNPAPVDRALPIVPGYEIIDELGRGGMAIVFKARQSKLHRLVALKMIRAGRRAGPEALERFRVEAEAVARLQHPHIVQIHEVGSHEGASFFALEFCPGGSLDQKLKQSPLPPRQAAATVEVLARAMSAVHAKGVLHRDLKPANILLAEDGAPKISDFGLAKNTVEDIDGARAGSQLTHANAIIGTPSYMAPEQALGGGKSVGVAADVYSLGAILYDCLTGRPPFQGASILETLEQVRTLEPPSPRQLNPNIPADLDTICLKCLRKEPGRRYVGASELADDLRRYLDGKPIQARPVSALERGWKWVKRHPLETGLTTTILILVVALTVGALVKNAELTRALVRSDEAKLRSDEAKDAAHAKLWESLRDRGHALRMSRGPGQRVESIRSIREALRMPTPPGHVLDELRTEAIAALALPDIERLQEWEGFPTGTIALDFDGDLKRYARLSNDGTVSVHRVDDNVPIARWSETADGPWPRVNDWILRFAQDGRFLAIRQPVTGRIVVRRVEGGESFVCPDHCPETYIDFSPDGERFSYSLPDGRIAVVTLGSGQVRYLAASGAGDPKAIRFSPDGRLFAFLVNRAGKTTIEIREAATGVVRQVLKGHVGNCFPTWHPNGQMLAAGGEDQLIRIWDIDSGKVIQKLEGCKNLGINCAFDSTGNRLLSNDWSGVLRLWEPSSGKQLLSVRTRNYNFLRFSADGRVASMSSLDQTKLQIWRLWAGSEYRTMALGDADSPARVDIKGDFFFKPHPDSRLLAVSAVRNSIADSVMIVDLAAGRPVARLAPGAFIPCQWDGSGNLLTCGPAGLLRWPLRPDAGEPEHYRCGPATRLLEDNANVDAEFGISADSRTVAIPAGDQGAILVRRGQLTQRRRLQPQQDVRNCAISPDGRWVATASHSNTNGFGANLWSADTGELIKQFPVSGICRVAFSPDGRWLLTTGGGCRLWTVGAWDESRFIGGAIGCFSPAGDMLAVDDSAGAIRLVNTATGDTVVRLEAPEQANLLPRGFTPDGSKLLSVGVDTSALHIWDLRMISKGLVELGLETGLPEYPPVEKAAPSVVRIEVE